MRPSTLFRFVLPVISLASQYLHEAGASSLITQGPWILNSTNSQRVHLKCANWYGAHQEPGVVGGLELRGVAALADLFKSSGANCVRLPYSVELVKNNPSVKREWVAGIVPSDNCSSTERALGVLDCVVRHLQARGVLVILNNHNSHAGWVGAGAAKPDQGLWNLPGYSTEDWIQSLEFLVRRYKVAGVDLRNEIHDQDGVRITWGETSDVDTDWLAASSAAYERIYRVDPDVLVIVGGLCWNTDLRAMVKNIGPRRAFVNRKLVYTVHVYSFSFWWTSGDNMIADVITPWALLLSLLCFLVAGVCLYATSQKRGWMWHPAYLSDYSYSSLNQTLDVCQDDSKQNTASWVSAFLSMSVVFHAGWLALSVFYFMTASSAGCSSFAHDSVWLVTLASVFVFFSSMGLVCCAHALTIACISGLIWLGLFFLSVFALGVYLSSDAAYSDALGAWSLDGRQVPVWVGEFGTGSPDEASFGWLWAFIHGRYDLDFAYWAFNGRKWMNGGWESESFGLANDQYTGWRIPGFSNALFDS